MVITKNRVDSFEEATIPDGFSDEEGGGNFSGENVIILYPEYPPGKEVIGTFSTN